MEEIKSTISTPVIESVDDGNSTPNSPEVKHDHGVTLIPRPSDDPRDPLNWPMSKKAGVVAVLCFAVFCGFVAPLAGQLNVTPQSKLYHTTTVHIAWQNSAGSAGLAVGGFFFAPISFKLGRSSTIFWTLLACTLTQVWAAEMTGEHQFNSFIVSRFFSGLFGGVTGVLGPRILVDLFFLHQRGRAFTIFHWCLNFGSVAGPTASAFIAGNRSWTLEFWWTVGLVGFTCLLCLLFMHETSWNREPGAVNNPAPEGFLTNRFATFFPGSKVAPKTTLRETGRIAAIPFLIAASPVTLVLSVYTLFHFGFYIAMNAITPTFLQKPTKIGGYGFDVYQNALFSFVHWIGIGIALIYGHFISDRLPLAICARNGGIWKPEYRLHALWVPGLIVNPIGLGITGLALQEHLSWPVLAVGQVMVTFASLSLIPITVNYICESFTKNPAEASIASNFYRLIFGLTVAFYIQEWIVDVSVKWTFGMMAFFDLVAFGFVVILMVWGHHIRSWSLGGLSVTEEGEKVVETASTDSDI